MLQKRGLFKLRKLALLLKVRQKPVSPYLQPEKLMMELNVEKLVNSFSDSVGARSANSTNLVLPSVSDMTSMITPFPGSFGINY